MKAAASSTELVRHPRASHAPPHLRHEHQRGRSDQAISPTRHYIYIYIYTNPHELTEEESSNKPKKKRLPIRRMAWLIGLREARPLVHLLFPFFVHGIAEEMAISVLVDFTTAALCPGSSSCSKALYIVGMQQTVRYYLLWSCHEFRHRIFLVSSTRFLTKVIRNKYIKEELHYSNFASS